MKLLILFLITSVGLTSCMQEKEVKKDDKHNNSLIYKQSYAIVRCDNCKIIYQTQEKKEDLNVCGISPKLVYHYSSGKTLKANIYPLGQDQDITYTVYNSEGRIVYNNILDQTTGDPTDVDVLLP